MTDSKFDLHYIAKLARLKLSEAELENFGTDLTNILELFKTIESINTDSIAPMAHPLELQQRLREDDITEKDQHQLFQSIAPAVEDNLYLVPKVIDNE